MQIGNGPGHVSLAIFTNLISLDREKLYSAPIVHHDVENKLITMS